MLKKYESGFYNKITNALLNYEVESLINSISQNKKIDEKDIVVERKILSVARNYESGIFEKCDHVKPNEAYVIVKNIIELKSEYTVLSYIEELENQINRLLLGKYYDATIIKSFLESILRVVNMQEDSKFNNRRCGKKNELFNF